jgi:hypothetical protein
MPASDSQKSCLSCASASAAFVLPLPIFVVMWIVTENWRYGLLAAFIAFFGYLTGATIVVSTIREPSAFMVWVPFTLGAAYTAMPNLPLPFDDAAVATAGAIATFALWMRRQPDVSKAVVIPLLFAALYTLVGEFIPLPVDELIVSGIGVASAIAIGGSSRRNALSPPPEPPPSIPPGDDDELL